MPSHGDLIIVAANNGPVPHADPRAFANPKLRAELERFQIRNVDDLHLHRIGGSAALASYFSTFGVPTNSDFHPYLDLKAPQARFMRAIGDDLAYLVETGCRGWNVRREGALPTRAETQGANG